MCHRGSNAVEELAEAENEWMMNENKSLSRFWVDTQTRTATLPPFLRQLSFCRAFITAEAVMIRLGDFSDS